MLSPRWVVGLVLIWICGLWVSNWVEGTSILTVSDLNIMDRTANITYTSGTSSQGSETLSAEKAKSTWETIVDALAFEFSYFYDLDPITGAKTPNIWYMIIKVPMMLISAIIGIFVCILIVQAFRIL